MFVSINDKLGKLLVNKQLEMQSEPTDKCPPIQDIASFIDGRIEEIKKQNLIAHLDSCPYCYETLTNTIQTKNEFPELFTEKKKADIVDFKPTRKQRIFEQFKSIQKKYIAVAAAAAVAAIIGFTTTKTQVDPLNNLPSAYNIAKKVYEQVNTIPSSTNKIPANFSNERDLLFKVGQQLTNIEINLQQNNQIDLAEDLKVFESMNLSPEIKPGFKIILNKLRNQIESGKNLKDTAGLTDDFVKSLPSKSEITYLRLGAWLEGLRIGLRSQPPLSPNAETADYFLNQLNHKDVRLEFRDELKTLQELLISNSNQKNTDPLIQSVDKLINLY